MAQDEKHQWIVPTEGANTLPVIEILTGRGFITGKSGSGKSNTASVIAEQLLDNNYNILIVDPEGEYYGLKEKYELLHVGNDDLCDAQVGPEQGDRLAEIALERNMPIILDVSGYLDADESRELIANTVRALFQKEREAQKPFLLLVEEMQEYLPQQGGTDELSELLERIAKRGRKRGLGMLGISQRPSSVDKDFITQCDWMVWHRLTWQNDIDVVRKVLGSDIADEVEDLDTGEGYLMTDWDESVDRVQFKQKETHDAGATPGLESYERPDLQSVSSDLVAEVQSGTVSDAGNDGSDPSGNGTQSEQAFPDGESLGDVAEAVEPSNPETADPFASSTAHTDAEGGSPDDLSIDDPGNGLSSDFDVDDLETMDATELREVVSSLERRNEILTDEVTELRTILQNVEEPKQMESSANRTTPATETPQTVTATPAGAPDKPVPPEPPEERRGIAGNLVELVYMVGYFLRLLVYRFRLTLYRRRYTGPGNATN